MSFTAIILGVFFIGIYFMVVESGGSMNYSIESIDMPQRHSRMSSGWHFPSVYHASGIIRIPSAGIAEPFEAWYAGKFNRSRIDYYGGTVKTFQREDIGKYGTLFEVIPKYDYRHDSHYQGCWKKKGKEKKKIEPQSVLPKNVYWPFKMNLTQYKFQGIENVNGTQCTKWVAKIEVLNRTDTYTFYGTDDEEPRPVRFEMKGYDVLLTSYYDYYIVDYTGFEKWNYDPLKFHIPKVASRDRWCQHVPKDAGEAGYRSLNPIAEFVDKEEYENFERKFKHFKRNFKKNYEQEHEDRKRMSIARHNMRFIHSMNRKQLGFRLDVNHFTDMTDEEYNRHRGMSYDDDDDDKEASEYEKGIPILDEVFEPSSFSKVDYKDPAWQPNETLDGKSEDTVDRKFDVNDEAKSESTTTYNITTNQTGNAFEKNNRDRRRPPTSLAPSASLASNSEDTQQNKLAQDSLPRFSDFSTNNKTNISKTNSEEAETGKDKKSNKRYEVPKTVDNNDHIILERKSSIEKNGFEKDLEDLSLLVKQLDNFSNSLKINQNNTNSLIENPVIKNYEQMNEKYREKDDKDINSISQHRISSGWKKSIMSDDVITNGEDQPNVEPFDKIKKEKTEVVNQMNSTKHQFTTVNKSESTEKLFMVRNGSEDTPNSHKNGSSHLQSFEKASKHKKQSIKKSIRKDFEPIKAEEVARILDDSALRNKIWKRYRVGELYEPKIKSRRMRTEIIPGIDPSEIRKERVEKSTKRENIDSQNFEDFKNLWHNPVKSKMTPFLEFGVDKVDSDTDSVETFEEQFLIDDDSKFPKDYFDAFEFKKNVKIKKKSKTKHKKTKIPEELDWRKYGAVSPIQSQGICGSCWTFSTAAAVESAHFIKTGELLKLSEQQLLDCTWYVPHSKEGNHGCMGGWTWKSFAYIKKFGLATSKSYGKYLAMESLCKTKNYTIGAKLDSFMKVKPNNAKALMKAIANYGPATASINTESKTLKFYKNGVYNDHECNGATDHSVLIVGYGKDNGKLYWIVRNSWGTNWGEEGYVKIKNGRCGLLKKPWVIINRKRNALPWLTDKKIGRLIEV